MSEAVLNRLRSALGEPIRAKLAELERKKR